MSESETPRTDGLIREIRYETKTERASLDPTGSIRLEAHARQLERELAEANAKAEDLEYTHNRNKPWMDKAQEMLDSAKWAGFPLIQGVVTELSEAQRETREARKVAENYRDYFAGEQKLPWEKGGDGE